MDCLCLSCTKLVSCSASQQPWVLRSYSFKQSLWGPFSAPGTQPSTPILPKAERIDENPNSTYELWSGVVYTTASYSFFWSLHFHCLGSIFHPSLHASFIEHKVSEAVRQSPCLWRLLGVVSVHILLKLKPTHAKSLQISVNYHCVKSSSLVTPWWGNQICVFAREGWIFTEHESKGRTSSLKCLLTPPAPPLPLHSLRAQAVFHSCSILCKTSSSQVTSSFSDSSCFFSLLVLMATSSSPTWSSRSLTGVGRAVQRGAPFTGLQAVQYGSVRKSDPTALGPVFPASITSYSWLTPRQNKTPRTNVPKIIQGTKYKSQRELGKVWMTDMIKPWWGGGWDYTNRLYI